MTESLDRKPAQEPRTSEEIQAEIPVLLDTVQKMFFPVDGLEIGQVRFTRNDSQYVVELKIKDGKRRAFIKERSPDHVERNTIIDENTQTVGVPFVANFMFLDNFYRYYNSKNSLKRAKSLIRKLKSY